MRAMNRYVALVLLCGSSIVTLCLMSLCSSSNEWRFQDARRTPRDTYEAMSDSVLPSARPIVTRSATKNFMTLPSRWVLADIDCIRRLITSEPCERQLTIAIPAGTNSSDPASYGFNVDYYEYDAQKDYLLFRSALSRDRAVLRYEATRQNISLIGGEFISVFAPKDPARFLWLWERGRFFPCQPKKVANRASGERRRIPLSFVHEVAKLRDLLIAHNATPLLSGGSLLGWYRECSIIPHTFDFDVMIPIAEHSSALTAALIEQTSSPIMSLAGRIGSSRKYKLCMAGVKFDLYYLYEERQKNLTYISGFASEVMEELRWYYPPLEDICAVDLLNRLMYVPCNSLQFIEMEYGPEWHVDHHSKDFLWYASGRNVESVREYEPDEWSRLYWNRVLAECEPPRRSQQPPISVQ